MDCRRKDIPAVRDEYMPSLLFQRSAARRDSKEILPSLREDLSGKPRRSAAERNSHNASADIKHSDDAGI